MQSLNAVRVQAEVKIKEDRVADLQEALKTQQAETDKAKQELTSALSTAERLKEGFKKERADWATEKAGLTKRAENAEAALKPVVDELTAVQRQIHSMTAAIFGKLLVTSVINLNLLYRKSGLRPFQSCCRHTYWALRK
mgnify:FL=1